jgi:hypothetical protein
LKNKAFHLGYILTIFYIFFKDEKTTSTKVDKEGGDNKDDKEKKEKEPEFEMLQNPSRAIKPQVCFPYYSKNLLRM